MNNTRKKLFFLTLFIFNPINILYSKEIGPLFKQIQAQSSTIPAISDENGPWVTVFVHGIMSIQPHLTLQNLMRFIRDDVRDSVYSKAVEYMRNDPYFYLNQAMQPFGLKKIDMTDLQPGNASNAIAHLYDEVTKFTNPHTESHYYTFGWSGLLSPSIRREDGIKLFNSLEQELEEKYWQYNVFPKIRLIGYSHGGNVCLNVAVAHQQLKRKTNLSIDELILVGIPVQTETDFLVNDDIFKKIYHVFSRADRIQRIDFFSFNRIFSRRYFSSRKNFKVPDKLMQLEMKFMRKAYSSRKKKEENYINFYNPAIVSGKTHLLRAMSPGHLEFWFFGWSPRYYRQHFTIHPLPAFIVLPYVLHCIKQIESKLINPHTVIADIRPEFETMLIKQRKINHVTEIFPFLSQNELEHLIRIANKVAIDSSFEDEYFTHVQEAVQKAKEYYHVYDKRKGRVGSFKRNRRMRKQNLMQKNLGNSS